MLYIASKQVLVERRNNMVQGNSHNRVENTKADTYYDKERMYLKEFESMLMTGFDINYFSGMKSDGMTANRYLTEEEQKIVVTVIQWLGTPVGNRLVKNVEGLE